MIGELQPRVVLGQVWAIDRQLQKNKAPWKSTISTGSNRPHSVRSQHALTYIPFGSFLSTLYPVPVRLHLGCCPPLSNSVAILLASDRHSAKSIKVYSNCCYHLARNSTGAPGILAETGAILRNKPHGERPPGESRSGYQVRSQSCWSSIQCEWGEADYSAQLLRW